MKCDDRDRLWTLVSQLLLLSHGQASVERGFSINKQMERGNLCEETFIAQRLVNDHVKAVGGVMGVTLTKELLVSCSAARSRYTAFPEKMQHERLSSAESNKRKSNVDEIDVLRSKRSRLESDIKDLTSCADDFAVRAEQDRDFGLVTKSNAMRKSAQEKATQLSSVQSDMDGMLKVLKGL